MALQRNVFEEKSTNRNDYKVPLLRKPVRYHGWTKKPKEHEKILKQKPYEPKDINTMQPWKDIKQLPFNTFWEIKPIVRTHPQFTFQEHPKVEDPLKWDVMKTRPRLYMTPAVSMDDIEDKNVREILCKNMYTTNTQKMAQEVNLTFTEREIPNSTFEKQVDPIKENYSIYKPLPAEIKKQGKEWEIKQLTTLVDPSRTYWTDFYNNCIKDKVIPVERDPFEKAISDETRKEIRDLVEKDELRQPYDRRKQGYTGHYPTNMIGPLRKLELSAKK